MDIQRNNILFIHKLVIISTVGGKLPFFLDSLLRGNDSKQGIKK